MNREIKFRAWLKSYDDSEGEMKYLPMHIQRFDFEDGWVMSFTNNPDFAYHERYENRVPHEFKLMQYTGLKDRDGLEIYEGDIVRWGDLPSSREKSVRVASVKWGDRGWEFVAHNIPCGHYPAPNAPLIFKLQTFAYGSDQLEVIGNIYENADLLNAKP